MFRKLMTFDEAKKLIEKRIEAKPVGVEDIELSEAYKRVLAEDVTSSLDIPPFDRSTVDGYAVKAEDTFGAEENKPITLKICGSVNIGELSELIVNDGEVAEIVTGAPIPSGADASVMVENTNRENDQLQIYRSVTKFENIMKKGTDIKKGETVLKAGRVLGSREVGTLAALGASHIKVYKIPKVAVISTGGEITAPGSELLPGKIFDINAYSLSTAVLESGGKPILSGVVPDEKDILFNKLKKALKSADIVLTSGGVSVGPKDIIPKTVDSLGNPGVLFSGVAIKPGKPTTLALIGKKIVFSFPGHPTSALLNFHLLAKPIIQSMAGRPQPEYSKVKAIAGKRMFSAKGRRTFVMVKLVKSKSAEYTAEPVETGASGAITTLAKADGFIEIPENQQFVDIKEIVDVTLFGEN